MGKRGPKGTNNVIKIAKGTLQPCRSKEDIHKSVMTNDDLICPDWLNDLAKEIWAEKLAIYNGSEVDVSNHGPALAQYCALEADIIKIYKEFESPSVSMISAHRIWAAEFFDTPASGHLKAKSKKGADDPWGNL